MTVPQTLFELLITDTTEQFHDDTKLEWLFCFCYFFISGFPIECFVWKICYNPQTEKWVDIKLEQEIKNDERYVKILRYDSDATTKVYDVIFGLLVYTKC